MKIRLFPLLIALTFGLSGGAFSAELKPGMGYTKLKVPEVCPSYIVRKGDTMGSIAKKFTATVAELMRVNSIKDAKILKVGQKLLIPKSVRQPR